MSLISLQDTITTIVVKVDCKNNLIVLELSPKKSINVRIWQFGFNLHLHHDIFHIFMKIR